MSTQSHRLIITELASCDGCAVLRVRGELDQSGEELFLGTLGACVDAGHPYLVLDVTALTFCDSRGLYCLLAMRWLLDRRGGRLLLAGAGRRLTELLTQTGSVELLPAQRSVGQALLSLPASHRPVWPPAASPEALDDGPRPPRPRPPSP
ncbi:anti-sigma factor antagonist [Streptomyces antnestii]|uniref:Anti-sigma factor antagonist n=1 Tax=Streptomyces antnestii TaxID=2494256 RepID=A0A3S2YZM7_9ACTN|nr:STAS domain-containing protein [Streptomyces sp. San01]RVU23658.1 anti-sigma factor antagonist [Streptomyces sp. San01]